MAFPTIGSQLIVFNSRYKIDTDTDLILNAIKSAGYAAVESGPKDAVSYRKKLDDRGLKYASSHTGLQGLLDLKPLIEYVHTMGAHDVCNSGFLKWGGLTLQDYEAGIQILNRAGRDLQAEGIKLHYHNHDFEFKPLEGGPTGMDLLLTRLDFDVIDLCVDVAWVKIGGLDPAQFLKDHSDLIGYIHLKDHDGTNWIELGQGSLDWPSVITAVQDLPHVEWAMIEQDQSQIDPVESVAISRKYLKDQFGL